VTDTIYVIRHAEKPDGSATGTNAQGGADPESLIVRGWQRAGALANFFGPNGGLPAPARIYASAPAKVHTPDGKVGSNSLRPNETVSVLAAKLGLNVNNKFTKGQEPAIASEATALKGTTLICWQHEGIPAIAKAILGTPAGFPQSWPADRFDVVWRFNRAEQTWSFDQVCQHLLPGDGGQGIA
jgi:broad specificity phosphatase PhoE